MKSFWGEAVKIGRSRFLHNIYPFHARIDER